MLSLIVNFNYLRNFFVIVVRGHKFCLFELRNCCSMCKWSFSDDGEVVHIRLTTVKLYILDSVCAATKIIPDRNSVQTHERWFRREISKRNCVTPISKVESHELDTLGVYNLSDNLSCRLTFDCFCLPSFYVLFSNSIEMIKVRGRFWSCLNHLQQVF